MIVNLWPTRMIGILFSLAILTACVSRYDRVDDVHPLSSECKDYAAFSKALAKQRDNGFTRRATMSMAGYSVGNKQNRETLYERYQTITDMIFEDYMIDPDSAKVMGKIICEQRQAGTWQIPVDADIPEMASRLRYCRAYNAALVDVEQCMVSRLQQYWQRDLAMPPGLDGS